MKLSLAATAVFALSLLGVTDAARIEISTTTGPGLIPSSSTVLIGNDGKRNNLGYFQDGCKKTKFSFIKNMCIDSGKKRAHVNYTSGLKRCFRQTKSSSKLCGGDESCFRGVCNRCWTYVFTEAKCNW